MKKIQSICYITSLILVITFIIKTIINYFQYDALINSAPFYVWILTNAVFLIIPALFVFVIGFILGKKR